MEKEEKIDLIIQWVQENYTGTIDWPYFEQVSEQIKEFKKVEIFQREFDEAENGFELFSCEGCGWTCSTDENYDGYCDSCDSDRQEEEE